MVIVDESEFLRLGLRVAIETSDDIEVVGDYSLSDEIVKQVNSFRPDVVLLSMRWPSTEGLNTCREIRGAVPSTKVVMFSSREREEETLASIVAGASGFVCTNSSRVELIRAIRVAASGGSYFDRGVTERVIGRLRELSSDESMAVSDVLTEREMSILDLVAEGFGNGEIGVRLSLATTTVRNNITKIRLKLGLDSRAKLVAYTVEQRLNGD